MKLTTLTGEIIKSVRKLTEKTSVPFIKKKKKY